MTKRSFAECTSRWIPRDASRSQPSVPWGSELALFLRTSAFPPDDGPSFQKCCNIAADTPRYTRSTEHLRNRSECPPSLMRSAMRSLNVARWTPRSPTRLNAFADSMRRIDRSFADAVDRLLDRLQQADVGAGAPREVRRSPAALLSPG